MAEETDETRTTADWFPNAQRLASRMLEVDGKPYAAEHAAILMLEYFRAHREVFATYGARQTFTGDVLLYMSRGSAAAGHEVRLALLEMICSLVASTYHLAGIKYRIAAITRRRGCASTVWRKIMHEALELAEEGNNKAVRSTAARELNSYRRLAIHPTLEEPYL